LSGSALRRFLQAGGALAPEIIRTIMARVPQASFYVMYGQTEATSRISTFECHEWPDKMGSAGRALDNLEALIIGPAGEALGPGEAGEIVVCGPSVTRGYWGDAQATTARCCGGKLRTGDIGRLDRDGFIWIEGRVADFLKMRGLRVSLGEIETRMRGVPGVKELAAFPAQRVSQGEAFEIAVVTDGSRDTPSIEHDLMRRVDPLWICSGIRFVPTLPRTDSGKVARGVLGRGATT
jgi:long-chain acyl-CoA synthetase